MPTDAKKLTALTDLALVWDELDYDDPESEPTPHERAIAEGKKTEGRWCGRWENGAPRFFGVGPERK